MWKNECGYDVCVLIILGFRVFDLSDTPRGGLQYVSASPYIRKNIPSIELLYCAWRSLRASASGTVEFAHQLLLPLNIPGNDLLLLLISLVSDRFRAQPPASFLLIVLDKILLELCGMRFVC